MRINSCEQEQIHLPGAIQPHGVLLVIDAHDETITMAAGSILTLLGFNGCALGRRLEEVIGQSLASLTDASGFSPGGEPLFLGSFRLNSGTRELDILAHERGGEIIIELEPSLDHRPSAARLLARLRAAIARINVTRTPLDACQVATEEIAAFTGLDRVMAYEFLGDGSGKIIAETRGSELTSFVNHHFPAGDIPAQARALYLRNHIRVIPDVNYVPVPVAGEKLGRLLDMSDCALRSVSPVHIQYLKNMGVAATLNVSVVTGGELWGMLTCHHYSPHLVPYETREACRQIGVALALLLESIAASARVAEMERLDSGREKLLGSLAVGDAIEPELRARVTDLGQLIGSDGVAVCYADRVATTGTAPPHELCLELASWVRRRDATKPFWTDQLSSHFESTQSDLPGGLLAFTATRDDPVEIMWFKSEYVRTIEWGGNPYAKSALGRNGELTPSRSFEIWRETVRGRAQPWSPGEILAAQRLRDGIERIRERQRLNRLQADVVHISRVGAMGALASTIAHELNQPLTACHNFLAGARKLLGRPDNLGAVSDVVEKAADQALRAGKVVRHLRLLIARSEAAVELQSVSDLVRDACALALLDAPRLGVSYEFGGDSDRDRVFADNVQIQQVLINLIRNALDALADAPEKRLRIGWATQGQKIAIWVEDSGPGIPAQVKSTLFEAFNTTKRDGLGIGLSISRTIVEAHGGEIWADNSDLGGTRVTFTLRRADRRA